MSTDSCRRVPAAMIAALPWRAVPDATRDTTSGHGRREIRTLKVLTIPTGIDFPHAAQALQIRHRRHIDQPKRFTTETVYAITDLRVHKARPAQLAAWIRGHWAIENKIPQVRDVTYDEDRSQVRTGTGLEVMAAMRNSVIGALRTAGIHSSATPRSQARQRNVLRTNTFESSSVTTTICLASARSIPTIAFVVGTNARSRVRRALRLRSPRETPLPLLMNVLLVRWDAKPDKRIRGTFLRRTDTQNVFLCR